ncbi:hypothetical protein [Saccharothrix sp. HUAS TT1]|uniref:hypothetical protein n=1 Tax=unclassified Saccharothrix TaxID=2593673 RepID=UPI00345C3854
MTFTTKMDWNGAKVTAEMEKGAVQGLKLGTEHVLGASRAVVPLEEATLERSGVASVDATALTGAVSYDTKYAARQHEELTWQHDEGRTAKYLERPMEEEADTVNGLIAAQIRRSLT